MQWVLSSVAKAKQCLKQEIEVCNSTLGPLRQERRPPEENGFQRRE